MIEVWGMEIPDNYEEVWECIDPENLEKFEDWVKHLVKDEKARRLIMEEVRNNPEFYNEDMQIKNSLFAAFGTIQSKYGIDLFDANVELTSYKIHKDGEDKEI